MAKRKPKSGGDIPEWIVTYGDLMSLLLCFFILLAAFSEMKKDDEFQKVLESIKEALGVSGGMGLIQGGDTAANTVMSMLSERVNRGGDGKFMDTNNSSNLVGPNSEVSVVHDGGVQTIGGSLGFPAGRTELSLDVKQVLRDEVAPRIKDKFNIVRIVGHSWGFQDATAGDHLSVAFDRARAVHEYLTQTCGVNPAILRIVAAGDAEPAAGDESENRRVQVYMTDMTIDQVHPDPHGTGRGRE